MNRAWSRVVLAIIVALFCVRNLPWNLDDYDQAKQAYVSYDMLERGHCLYQHTPRQEIATKPPLMGWFSAGLYLVTHSWNFAWRFPPFLASLILLYMLWKDGQKALPGFGGIIACGFFALNGLAPRIATLVRTDMPLTLFIFLIGRMIWRHVKEERQWSLGEKWALFFCVLATMLTKGPIVYAFVFPGLAIYAVWCWRSGRVNHSWGGSWAWFGPLLLFGAWALAGALIDKEFYTQVVLKEFLGRFDEQVHKSQPWFFYGHLILRAAPWTVLLIGLIVAFAPVRRAMASQPAMFWLMCWALGGFVLMSAIPSKRVDRIFPILPPLALLLPSAMAVVPASRTERVRRLGLVSLALAVLANGAYAGVEIAEGFRDKDGELVRFGGQIRDMKYQRDRLAVVFGGDEGMILYCGVPEFTDTGIVDDLWKRGTIDAAVLPTRWWEKNHGKFDGASVRLETSAKEPEAPKASKQKQYLLITRDNNEQK